MAGVFLGLKSLKATASCVKIISIVLLTLGSTIAAPSQESDIWNNPCFAKEETDLTAKRHMRSTAQIELLSLLHMVDVKVFDELNHLYPNDTQFQHNQTRSTCIRLNRIVKPQRYKSKRVICWEKCPQKGVLCKIGKYNVSLKIVCSRAEFVTLRTTSGAFSIFMMSFVTFMLILGQQRFYVAMFDLYQFLDKLENIRITTEVKFDLNKRREIYETSKRRLRLAICEFNDTFRQDFGKTPSQPKMHCIPDEADQTRVRSFDIHFFKKLKKFLKVGKKMVKKWSRNHRKHKKVSAGARTKTNSS